MYCYGEMWQRACMGSVIKGEFVADEFAGSRRKFFAEF
jgi:hypothetical protein